MCANPDFLNKLERPWAERGMSAALCPEDFLEEGSALPTDEPAGRCLGAQLGLLTSPLTSLGPGSPPDVVELCGNQLPGLSLQCGKAADGIERARQADQAERAALLWEGLKGRPPGRKGGA